MTRRRRAILMLMVAAVAALLAIAVVQGYSSSVAESYGGLRPVVVVTRTIPPGKTIVARMARSYFETRLVPERFAPAAALRRARDAIGLQAWPPLLPGGYLTSNLLRRPSTGKGHPAGVGPGRHAVQIAVSGAGALSGANGTVDVLVTGEPDIGSKGRTYVAARRVPLLAISGPDTTDAATGTSQATLGLTRRQAVELVEAESFARRITLLPRNGGRR